MDIGVKRIEGKDGGFFLQIQALGTFRCIIHTIDDDTTRTLKIPENWSPNSVEWMDEQRFVLFSASEYDRENKRAGISKIYKYDLATDMGLHS